tara:strand:+ start:314 stop:1039 length:726 start_codon:yes stop_codon:yes gene_type:complete
MLSELISCINSNYEQFKINNNILKINKLFTNIEFYSIENKLDNNSFYESLLYILDQKFIYLSNEQKSEKIDQLKKYIVFNYPEYYRKYKDSLNNIKDYSFDTLLGNDITNINIKQIVNFLDINLYLFNKSNISIFFSEREIISKYKPTIIMEYRDYKYIPMIYNKNGLYSYIEHDEILNVLYDDLNWETFNDFNITKMKVAELREFCKNIGIKTTKKSEKTDKKINRTKKELINYIKLLYI